jgi:hypothetical protein
MFTDNSAYKADTLRRLGAYEMMVPNAPVPTKDVKAAALANAAWVMGMHPSYSMYKAAKGLESIKKFM